MTAVPLGMSYDNRIAAQSPKILVKNMFLEQALTNQVDQVAFIMRPALITQPGPAATGVCRGIFQQAGFANGLTLLVFGTQLWMGGSTTAYSVVGTISGTDQVIFACSRDNLLLVANGSAYTFDGTTFTGIAMPDGEVISWGAYLAGYFLLGVQFTETIFFYVDGTPTVDALDFFSAETNAGYVFAGAVLLDQLLLLKQTSTEFWQASGDADLPFNRIVGQVYQKGIVSSTAFASSENTLCFIGNDCVVYQCAATPQRISNNAVEEQLRINAFGNFYIWSFDLDGHTYLVLTISSVITLVYDMSSQQWYNWADANSATWSAQLGVQIGGNDVLAVSLTSHVLYSIAQGATGDEGAEIDCELMGGVPVIGRQQRCDNFQLVVDSGAASDPLNPNMEIDLRWSDDQGQTYSSWVPMYAGASGQYSAQPVVRMLGTMRPPSRIFHMRCSTIGPFRVSYARINEYSAAAWRGGAVIVPVTA